MPGVNNVAEVVKLYFGNTWFLPLFLLALLYLFWKGSRENRIYGILTAAAALVFVFNDAIFMIASKIIDSETYYRFLWMIPVVPILAYVVVDLLTRQKRMAVRILIGAAALFLLWQGGTSCIKEGSFVYPWQVHYLNEEAKAVGNIIVEDTDESYPRVAVDGELVGSMRLYHSEIVNYIKRDVYRAADRSELSTRSEIREYYALRVVNGVKLKRSLIQKIIQRGNIHYFVINKDYEMEKRMKKCGCTIAGQTQQYTVFRCPAIDAD